MFWPIRILWALVRNRILLLPHAEEAKNDLIKYLNESQIVTLRIVLTMGVGDQLICSVIFKTESQLADFKKLGMDYKATEFFKMALKKFGFPERYIPRTIVTFHSQEAIDLAGGDWNYFNN